jgi:hypothetical protein
MLSWRMARCDVPRDRKATVDKIAAPSALPAREELHHASWSSSALASCRTGVSKPSVNQP